MIIEVQRDSHLTEILSVKTDPKSSLLATNGINGLKPELFLSFEVTDAFKKMEIEYVYTYREKEYFDDCEVPNWWLISAKRVERSWKLSVAQQ